MKTDVLLSGLTFGEGPRWHDGRLWFSDMHDDHVMTVDLEGRSEVVIDVPQSPSGLGWLPDGRPLVVSMRDRRLLRVDPEGTSEVADLSPWATWHCNDMVVDTHGRAYVGNFGSDIEAGSPPRPAVLLLVMPDGAVRPVADELVFPNGAAITEDGRSLLLAETFACRLTAFDVGDDGSLSNRREWASLPGLFPDGICLDAEGAVWAACPFGGGVVRVREGGEIVDRIEVETEAFACMLGGPERRHLFVCTAKSSTRETCRTERDGRIEVAEVDVPGAGLP